MPEWLIENKIGCAGTTFHGSFGDAIAIAVGMCPLDWHAYSIWQQPANIVMAEVNQRGAYWIKHLLAGEEVKTLMRRYHRTIKQLSFQMGITAKRIREVRSKGLDDRNAVRDWLEAITGTDPGPLPERYRISGRLEESDCGYCGCPLFSGDEAHEYAASVFCSITCCRDFYKHDQQRATA